MKKTMKKEQEDEGTDGGEIKFDATEKYMEKRGRGTKKKKIEMAEDRVTKEN